MKQSSLVVSLAVVAMAGSAARALPFYSPDYTFDSTTGTGYKYGYSVFSADIGDYISPDGKAANTLLLHESDVSTNYTIATWRGPSALPSPQLGGVHASGRVFDISRYGWTLGQTAPNDDESTTQAAIWQPNGTRTDLPHLSQSFPNEPAFGVALDMNDASVVVGSASKFENNQVKYRPVYWTSSRQVVELSNPLAIPNQYWVGTAAYINSSGIIVGTVGNGGDTINGVKWDLDGNAEVLSKTTDTGITLPWTLPEALLDDGTVVGWGRINNNRVGLLWTSSGQAIELRNLLNSTAQLVEGTAINNSHYSIGRARNSSGQYVAVRWSPTGEPLALDRLQDAPNNATDLAYDINDLNFAVGKSVTSVYQRAVLWTPDGDAIDINSLVESDEWNLSGVGTITNTGWISGVGKFDPAGPAAAYLRPFSILVPFAGTYGMGDANFDESIDFADLLIVAQHYASSTGGSVDAGDFNFDGVVDFTDLLAIAQNYGDVLGDSIALLPDSANPTFVSDWQTAQAMVPEPGAISGVIGVGLILRRQRRR